MAEMPHHSEPYTECLGLVRLLIHETVLQLRSQNPKPSMSEVFEACQHEAAHLRESELSIEDLDQALAEAKESGWLKLTRKQIDVTEKGWRAYGWNLVGRSEASCTRTIGAAPWKTEESLAPQTFLAAPFIMSILAGAHGQENADGHTQRDPKFCFDPRLSRGCAITNRDLHNWTAFRHWNVDGYAAALQKLVTLGFVDVVGTGPLDQYRLLAATKKGRNAWAIFQQRAEERKGRETNPKLANPYEVFEEPDGDELQTLLTLAIRCYIQNCGVDLQERISSIRGRDNREAAQNSAESAAWPIRGARLDELIRLILGGSAHRIQGAYTPSFGSLLRLLQRDLHQLPTCDVSDVVWEHETAVSVPQILDIIREALEGRNIHVAGVHTFPGERPSIEGVLIEEGLPLQALSIGEGVRKPRLVLNTADRGVTLDGVPYELPQRRFEIFAKLASNPQALLKYSKLRRANRESSGERPDMILKDLPKLLRKLLRRVRGKGIMLDVPAELIRVS